MQFWLQLVRERCSHRQAGAGPWTPALFGAGFLPRPGDHSLPRARRYLFGRPWKPWTPTATPRGTGPVPWPAPTRRSAACWRIWSSGWATWTGCTARSRRTPKPWRTLPRSLHVWALAGWVHAEAGGFAHATRVPAGADIRLVRSVGLWTGGIWWGPSWLVTHRLLYCPARIWRRLVAGASASGSAALVVPTDPRVMFG